MQASLLATAALTAEVDALKQGLERTEQELGLAKQQLEEKEGKRYCRCQNRWISGRGSRTVRQGRMVTGDKGHDVFYPGSGPLDGGNTLLLLD